MGEGSRASRANMADPAGRRKIESGITKVQRRKARCFGPTGSKAAKRSSRKKMEKWVSGGELGVKKRYASLNAII